MTDTVVVPVNPAGTIVSDGNNNRQGWDYKDVAYRNAQEEFERFFDIRKDIADNGLATELSIEKNARANELATEKAGAANALAAVLANSEARLALQVQATAVALGFAASNAATAMGFAATAKDAAECCCETQKLIQADGEKTRDLVTSYQTANLAVQLDDAKTEIAILKAKFATIVTA